MIEKNKTHNLFQTEPTLEKDSSKAEFDVTPMMAQFWEIKNTVPDCLLFYRMGDFYELFFDDAVKASSFLDITLTQRGQHHGKAVPMCGVPVHAHENYLHKLIASGLKIAICEQLEDPKEAKKRGAKSVVKRGIVRIVTPGTITEDHLLDAKSHNYLCCIFERRGQMAISWMDISTGDFFVQKISSLQVLNFLRRIDSGEILLPEEKKPLFANVIAEFETSINFLPISRFDSKNAALNLCHFFDIRTLDVLGEFTDTEIAAAGGLLDYVRLMQIDSMPHIRPLQALHDHHFMEIDAAARINLEICNSVHGRKNSLLGNIENCCSVGGARLFKEWLNAPLFDLHTIIKRHDGITEFQNFAKTAEILGILQKNGDSERALNRLSLGRGSPRDMKVIADSLEFSFIIKAILASIYQKAPAIIQEAFDNIHNMTHLKNKLYTALRKDLPAQTRDGGFIAKGYCDEFDTIQEKAVDGDRILRALEKKYRKETTIETLKIKHNNVLGTFIEIPSRHANKLDTSFIHRQSTVNTARFTTNDLEKCARDVMHARERALAMELEIFQQFCSEILENSAKIFDVTRALAILDVMASHAEFAQNHEFCRPKMDESEIFLLEAARHPIVEALSEKNHTEFIANDCALRQDNYLWLITGPNMAGKSTFLRQNALIAVMAQAGFFVPAKSASIGLIDKLFSRVGASDDIARGHSTFMVEMLETSVILNRAGKKSFVILDEIGRGTATFDGLSLAYAITEYLHDVIQCRTLFATHYHELNQLQAACRHIQLMHATVREYHDKIMFTYQLSHGSAERSYGIHVARLAGISEEILGRAEEILLTLETEKNSSDTTIPKAQFHGKTDRKKLQNIAQIKDFLKNTNPDTLTPREALDCLYRLKMLSS